MKKLTYALPVRNTQFIRNLSTVMCQKTHRPEACCSISNKKAHQQSIFKRALLQPLHRQLHSSEADTDLAEFLKKEITYQETFLLETDELIENLAPFVMQVDGTLVTLERRKWEEEIKVVFNINGNKKDKHFDRELLLAEYSYMFEDPSYEEQEDYAVREFESIFSAAPKFPAFSVYITKRSGKTLCFQCKLNQNINENFDEDKMCIEEGQKHDFLIVSCVQLTNCAPIYNNSSTFKKRFKFNDELYGLLLNTLLVRGINGEFVNTLTNLAAYMEQYHYVNHMRKLKSYVNAD